MRPTHTMIHGRHFGGAELNAIQLEGVGGVAKLHRIQHLMEWHEQELPVCPFCGAPAMLEGLWTYADPAVRVICSACKCSTNVYGSSVHYNNFFTGQPDTLEDAILKAVTAWKRRVPGEAV